MTGIPNEVVIPPSPNWYLSSVFECHKKSGILAYAASRCLVFLKPHEENVGFPNTRVIADAHNNKITCELALNFLIFHCHVVVTNSFYVKVCLGTSLQMLIICC